MEENTSYKTALNVKERQITLSENHDALLMKMRNWTVASSVLAFIVFVITLGIELFIINKFRWKARHFLIEGGVALMIGAFCLFCLYIGIKSTRLAKMYNLLIGSPDKSELEKYLKQDFQIKIGIVVMLLLVFVGFSMCGIFILKEEL